MGEYSLRIYANSTLTEGSSDTINITVKARTYVADVTSNQTIVPRNASVIISAKLLNDLSQPMEGYNLTFIDETENTVIGENVTDCLLYTSPSPRDLSTSRMPSSA